MFNGRGGNITKNIRGEKEMKKLMYPIIALVLALGLALPTAIPALADDSGFKFPTQSEGSAYTPERAYVDDVAVGEWNTTDTVATFNHYTYARYYGFGFGIPSGATINDIEVVVSGWYHSQDEGVFFRVRLSGDTGNSWTEYKQTPELSGHPDANYTLGGIGDLWGQTWNTGNFSDASFRLEIEATHWDYLCYLDSVSVKVYYTPLTCVFGGFLPPINADGGSVLKLGRTVPVKFQLTDANGNFVSNAAATISLQKFNGSTPEGNPIDGVSTSAATTGNLFRYDSNSNQYIFNLNTKGLSVGTWQIKATLDNGESHTVFIVLK